LEAEQNNLFHNSRNYLMTKPKDGRRDEWEAAQARIAILEPWLAEFPSRRDDTDENGEAENA
jgi:hypothetical protein